MVEDIQALNPNSFGPMNKFLSERDHTEGFAAPSRLTVPRFLSHKKTP
jgi:hypothetical protein